MASIKEIPQEEPKYIFTCKRCGHNVGSDVSVHTHKLGGPGLGFSKMHVCTNCRNGSNLRF